MKYKSGILLLFFIFCQVQIMAGQNNSFGVYIGTGLSGVKEPMNEVYLNHLESVIVDYELARFDYNQFGFRVGVNKTWDLGRGFYIRSGLEYAQKGNKIKSHLARRFNLIEIPVLIQHVFPGKTKYTIFAGTSFDFMLSSIYDYTAYGGVHKEPVKTQEFYRLNQSFVVGTGYSVPIDDKFDIQFRLYYSNGLLNLVKDKNRVMDVFSSSFSATIGFQYFIKN